MNSLTPFAFVAAVLTPSFAFACGHTSGLISSTYPADYMMGGVAVVTLVILVFGKAFRNRAWMVPGAILSGMLSSYILGSFFATDVDPSWFGVTGILAIILSVFLLVAARFKTRWLRNTALLIVLGFSALGTYYVASEQAAADQVYAEPSQQINEVIF